MLVLSPSRLWCSSFAATAMIRLPEPTLGLAYAQNPLETPQSAESIHFSHLHSVLAVGQMAPMPYHYPAANAEARQGQVGRGKDLVGM